MIDGYVKNVLVLEPGIRRSKSCAAVFANLHALALGADNQTIGMIRIDDDGVDNPIAGSDALKIILVGSLPQAAGGSGVEHLGVLGILADQLRSTEHERNAFVLGPVLRAVHAVINAGAGGGVHVFRIGRIDNDAHDVGIIDHAGFNREPVFAAVGSFPWQVVGSGVNGVFVAGIESDRVKVAKVFVLRWSDQGPVCAVVSRAVNTGQ